MKKPIAILMTDTHLKTSNIEQNISIYKQAIQLAKKLQVDRVYHLGDIFDARKSQPLQNLHSFGNILRLFSDSKIVLMAISGNHDKVNYESEDSYLDEFGYHPNFILAKDLFYIQKGDILLWLIPYFKEESIYPKYLDKVGEAIGKMPKRVKNMLLTHISVNGVKNNEYNEVENDLTLDRFELFDKVFVGHNHNQSQVGKNIFYIGSALQHNFGEDSQKGFTILYDDGSHGFLKSEFREFKIYDVDLDKQDENVLNKLLSEVGDDNIRFRFSGDESKLKSLDINKYTLKGIDVKLEPKKINEGILSASNDEFVKFNQEAIKEEFDIFCEENQIENKQIGKKYLNTILE